MFNMLTQLYIGGDLILQPTEAHDLVHALTIWMQTISAYEMGRQLEAGALHSVDALSFGMYEAIVSALFVVIHSQIVVDR
jgi:hypothetical protein